MDIVNTKQYNMSNMPAYNNYRTKVDTSVCLWKIEGIGKLTQHKSKRKALRRGKQRLNHVLELFKFLKSYREYKNKFLREVYVYVNEWHRMIYHPFMFNGFKISSHRENNKVPLLLCLNKLSS